MSASVIVRRQSQCQSGQFCRICRSVTALIAIHMLSGASGYIHAAVQRLLNASYQVMPGGCVRFGLPCSYGHNARSRSAMALPWGLASQSCFFACRPLAVLFPKCMTIRSLTQDAVYCKGIVEPDRSISAGSGCRSPATQWFPLTLAALAKVMLDV